MIHAENTIIPRQVIICAPRGSNNTIQLPFKASFYDLRGKNMPRDDDLVIRDGLRLFLPEAALIRVPGAFFAHNPVEARVAISGIRDMAGVLKRLLAGGHSCVAGRFTGALRRFDRANEADEILTVMKRAGYDFRKNDPFVPAWTCGTHGQVQPPIVSRLKTMWGASRESIIQEFPRAPGLPGDANAYLSLVDNIYRNDAYHSLSIEGYRVTHELVERVRTGRWDPHRKSAGRQDRDALAARGYWQAFKLVRETVNEVIGGARQGNLVRMAHRD